LANIRQDAPPFAVFADSTGWADGLRFGGGLATQRRDDGLADDVLAGFGDRSAFLVMTACGDGMLAVLNADLGASNLPSSPAFVPLIGELSSRLLGRPRSSDAVPCGE